MKEARMSAVGGERNRESSWAKKKKNAMAWDLPAKTMMLVSGFFFFCDT